MTTAGQPLRVLHVCVPAPAGGLERVVQGLAAGHAARGHAVTVAAVLAGDGEHPFLTGLRETRVEVVPVVTGARGYLRERRAVAELLRSRRIQVLHTHGYRPDLLDAGVARRRGVATVTTVHGNSKLGGRTAVYEWLQLRGYRRFDAVVAVSQPLVEELVAEGVRRERIRLVPNGWAEDVAFETRDAACGALGLAPGVPVIGWAGRLIPAKGADVFVRALAGLRERAWQAVLIGDGAELEPVRALLREAGIVDRVLVTGRIDRAAALFPAFDTFVLSSRTEGTPIALLEAIAAGVPVVATAVGGVPDVVPGGAGLLVPSEDPAALAGAIARVLDEPAAALARARAARAHLAARFGREAFLDGYEAVYREVTRGR